MIPTAFTSSADSNPLYTDVNDDGFVNILDLSIVAYAWNSYPGHTKWNPRVDLNGDDVVNIIDMVLVVTDFGMTWVCYDFDKSLDWNVVSGTWSIMNGLLEGFSNAQGLVYTRDMTWKDYTLTAKVKIAADSPKAEAAFCVGLVDSENFYLVGLGCWNHRVSISRIVNGVPEELIFSGDIAEITTDVWYVVSIKVSDCGISLYVNAVLELEINDSTFASGGVGVRSWNSHILVDHITVSGFPSAVYPDEPTRLLLFQDDFNGILDDWEIVDGDWYIEDGKLRGDCFQRGVILYKGDAEEDYEISCKVHVIQSPTVGYEAPDSWTEQSRPEAQIIVRYEGSGNYYFCGLGAYGYFGGVGKFVGGSASMVVGGGTSGYAGIKTGVWYQLKVRVIGNTITVFIDEQEICSVEDNSHTTGRIGLTSIYSSVYFDDFVIKKIDSVPLNPLYRGFQLNTRRYWAGTVWEPDQSDYDQIASWGINTLKSICWYGRDLEPDKNRVGVYTESYMNRLDKHIRMMAKANINYIAGIRVCWDDDEPLYGWATASYVCTSTGLERYCNCLEWFVQWLESKNYPNLIGYEPWLMPFHKTSPTSSQKDFYYDHVMPTMADAVKKHSNKLLFMTPIHQSREELKNVRTSFIENNRGRAYYGFGFYWYKGMQHTRDVTVWDYDYDAQKEYLQPALDFRNKHNVPLYIIEFGVRGERQDQVDVLDYKLTLLEENNISWIGYWQYDKYGGSTSWALLNYPADTPRWKLVNVFRKHCLGK